MSRIDDVFNDLADGRVLNPFDREAVLTVAGLVCRVRDARNAVEREGAIIDDGKGFPIEHPAIQVEKRASAEIRGWVKERPDLFGRRGAQAEAGGRSPAREKFGGFKVV